MELQNINRGAGETLTPFFKCLDQLLGLGLTRLRPHIGGLTFDGFFDMTAQHTM